MEVIPEPAEGTAAIITGGEISFAGVNPYALFSGGGGDTDYICGACKVVLGAGLHRGQIKDLVFHCPSCKSYNTVRGT